MRDLKDKTVLVTGGTSMIGSAICESLHKRGAKVDECPHSKVDLLDHVATHDYFLKVNPDYIIHAAGWNGGIEWNKRYPATIYHRTARMALNVYSQGAYVRVLNKKLDKMVGILASCSYPDLPEGYFSEHELWNGLPNHTVECHGLAKRIIADYGRMIWKQHQLPCISCILTNSFGPGDSYNPDKTKVVGGLIRRFVDAKQKGLPSVDCWGTGKPLREFMYSKDAGEAIVQVLEKYEDTIQPINIGSGDEVSIRDLTEVVAQAVGYSGEIKWDETKADGQLKKKLNTSKMKGFVKMNITPFKEAIKETVDWYLSNKEIADAKTF